MPESQPAYDHIVGAGPPGGCRRTCPPVGSPWVVVNPPLAAATRPLYWTGGRRLADNANCSQAAANYFSGLCLHSWDLKRTVKAGTRSAGLDIDARLRPACSSLHNGPPRMSCPTPKPAICTWARTRSASAKQPPAVVLLIGDGLDSRATELARLATVRESDGLSVYAEALFEPAGQTGLDVVISASRSLQIVVITRAARRGCVRLFSHEPGAPVERLLRDFLAVACESRLIPTQPEGEVKVGFTAAGAALEFETLVGKRCLQIGETGGSCCWRGADLSCMRSGWMAAEAAPCPENSYYKTNCTRSVRPGASRLSAAPEHPLLLMPLVLTTAMSAWPVRSCSDRDSL